MNIIILGMKNLLDNHDLTTYERSVLESMLDQAKRKGCLSEKQIALYDSIASNYTEFAIAEKKAWEFSFDESRRKTLMIVASYYAHRGEYFLALAGKVLEDRNFIPSHKVYQKMCENKYAKRVVTEHFKKPKYGVGDMVYPVSKAPSKIKISLKRGAIILRPNAEPVISSAKGAKRYLVLPVGEPHGVLVEERWLKSRRDRRNGQYGNDKKRRT